MRRVYRLLFALHVFVGIGAAFGGSSAIIDPYKPLGMPIDPLKNSPFSNYLIPGIILFTVIGLGNIFSALMLHFKTGFRGYTSSASGCALVIWILVQCIMLNAVAFPHILFFSIGVVQIVLSIIIMFDQRLFPTKLILNFYKVVKKKFNIL